MSGVFLGVETGGSKILARLVSEDGDLVAEGRWPTSTPDAAADAISRFVAEAKVGADLRGVGLAAFGPLIVDPDSSDQGRVLATPKPGWTGSNLRRELARRLGVPVRVDTDVNAAALAELTLGAGRDVATLAYITVGTGIGGGLATRSGTLRGALHPEIGHLRLVRAAGDKAQSACPYHADCAEGLAAGPAVAARMAGADLGARPDIQDLVAGYIAQLAVGLVLSWSPHLIVIGGGVGGAAGLLGRIRSAFGQALGDYGVGPVAHADDFIMAPSLADAGLEGALLMAANPEIRP